MARIAKDIELGAIPFIVPYSRKNEYFLLIVCGYGISIDKTAKTIYFYDEFSTAKEDIEKMGSFIMPKF